MLFFSRVKIKEFIKVQEWKRKQGRCLVFTSSIKREIRHFHVVVMQWRQRNVQKSVMHVQSCCLASRSLLLFCRSRWRRRRRCLRCMQLNYCQPINCIHMICRSYGCFFHCRRLFIFYQYPIDLLTFLGVIFSAICPNCLTLPQSVFNEKQLSTLRSFFLKLYDNIHHHYLHHYYAHHKYWFPSAAPSLLSPSLPPLSLPLYYIIIFTIIVTIIILLFSP